MFKLIKNNIPILLACVGIFFTFINCINTTQHQCIIFLSEFANGKKALCSLYEDGSKGPYGSFDVSNLKMLGNSLRCGKGPHIIFLTSEARDWLHGYSTHTTLRYVNLQSHEQQIITKWNMWENVNYSWNTTGTMVYYSSIEKNNEGIYSYDVKSFQTNKIIEGDSTNLFGYVRISSSEEKLAYVDGIKIFIMDLKTKTKKEVNVDANFLDFLEWISGDSLLLISTEQGYVKYNVIKNIHKKLTIDGFDLDISPDGKNIAFVKAESDSITNIFTIGLDGENLRKLTKIGANISPDWSPDGKKIVFVSNRDGNWEIYLMNKDGKHKKRLTENRYSDHVPRWLPLSNF